MTWIGMKKRPLIMRIYSYTLFFLMQRHDMCQGIFIGIHLSVPSKAALQDFKDKL